MVEVLDVLKTGSWVAFAAFGTYLAYKLAIATVITVGVVKAINKIVSVWATTRETTHRIYQLVARAGMQWPLSPEEWEELYRRVTPK